MLNYLNTLFPVRYTVFFLSALGLLMSIFSVVVFGTGALGMLCFGLLAGLGIFDVQQTKSSILRNYPVIGHLRFMLEYVRPEIRQYFIEGDSEASPSLGRSARWSINVPKASPTSIRLARNSPFTPKATSG